MSVEILIRLPVCIISYAAFVMLTFSIFKMPLVEHHRIITTLALIMGSINYYIKFVLHSPLFPIIYFAFFMVFLMLLKKYPLFYCLVVCGTGFVVSSLIDMSITIITVHWLADYEFMTAGLWAFVTTNSVFTVICVLIALMFRKLNIGFSFIIKRFNVKQALKSYNFIWAAILILSIVFVQLTVDNFRFTHMQTYLFLGGSISMLLTVAMAYRQNKKALKSRFRR